MYFYFPATLDPHEDGSGRYDVTFVDLPGCVSQGKDLGDALRMAREALTLHLSSMLADGDPIPAPSTLEDARRADEAEALAEGYSLAQGTIWQHISIEAEPRKPTDAPVRLSISLKPSIIAKIDALAGEMGLTRSAMINVATREYISRIQG
ncbi:MAG: type II toxin-antitoxin system HicB family antitoxin [Desulfobulbus sp.]|nr:type II toxin-antitoxin system HicB family antitoxin [Desulfobulbus sp.]